MLLLNDNHIGATHIATSSRRRRRKDNKDDTVSVHCIGVFNSQRAMFDGFCSVPSHRSLCDSPVVLCPNLCDEDKKHHPREPPPR